MCVLGKMLSCFEDGCFHLCSEIITVCLVAMVTGCWCLADHDAEPGRLIIIYRSEQSNDCLLPVGLTRI